MTQMVLLAPKYLHSLGLLNVIFIVKTVLHIECELVRLSKKTVNRNMFCSLTTHVW
jgi:hypothetical protein